MHIQTYNSSIWSLWKSDSAIFYFWSSYLWALFPWGFSNFCSWAHYSWNFLWKLFWGQGWSEFFQRLCNSFVSVLWPLLVCDHFNLNSWVEVFFDHSVGIPCERQFVVELAERFFLFFQYQVLTLVVFTIVPECVHVWMGFYLDHLCSSRLNYEGGVSITLSTLGWTLVFYCIPWTPLDWENEACIGLCKCPQGES